VKTYWDTGTSHYMTVIDERPGAITSRQATHDEIRAGVVNVPPTAPTTATDSIGMSRILRRLLCGERVLVEQMNENAYLVWNIPS
jgi:hypothetical protein